MKFLHFSDTHIGKRNFKLEEREKDFEEAFKQCIDAAIGEGVDFVIHAGDMFDIGRPSHKSIIFVIGQLKRLKEKDIPIFTVSGSHDMSLDDTVISILEKVNLITNLSHQRFFEITDENIILNGIKFRDTFLCGIAGRRANIKEIFQSIKVKENDAKYKIFVFHHTISSISPLFEDIPTALLPQGFDYYAGGHWHFFFSEKHSNGIIAYPGSSEFVDLKEMRHGGPKNAILVDTQTKQMKRLNLKTRNINVEDVDCNNMTPEEINNKCISLLKDDSGTLLILELKGKMRGGNKGEVDKLRINEEAIKRGYLHCNIHMAELLTKDEEIRITSKGKTIDAIENEYLQKKGYSQKQTSLAKRIINELGSQSTNSAQLQQAVKGVVEEIENDIKEYRIEQH